MRLLPPALVAGCLSAFFSVSAFAQTPPKAAYGFEEAAGTTTSDSSGNGNTGVLNGPAWAAGRIGNALSFDGVNDRVEVADSDTLDFTTGLTISAWLKPASAPSSSIVVAKESVMTGWSYGLHFLSDGRLQVVLRLENSFYDAVLPTTLPIGVWTHVAATFDGGMIRMYCEIHRNLCRILTQI